MSYWLVPSLCVLLAIGLSLSAHAIDSRLSQEEHAWYLFRGGPEGARSVLTAVASSMMTFAGLVFSVTILVRALSPGINDPTTAVQTLDQLHGLLRRMVLRRFPTQSREDEDGSLRLICPRPDWSSYVRLAVDEVREFGQGSIQVVRRLRFLLEDLLRVAPAYRREELERQMALLEASVERAFPEGQEAAMAHRANPQGHGPH